MQIWINIAIIVGFCLSGNFVTQSLLRWLTRKHTGIHVTFLKSLLRLLWGIAGISYIASLFPTTKGVATTILTSSGLIVAVLGFAAQQVLADFVSGIMLSWTKPFDVGEKISISDMGISGIVDSMTLRHTVIRTYHNSRLIVPNSVINKAVVENSNYYNDYIGNYLEVPISYDSDVDKAIEIMEDVISSHPLVLDVRTDKTVGKKSFVYIKDFEERGIVLKNTVCTKTVDDNFTACGDIRRELKRRFDEAGIRLYDKKIKIIE